MEPSDGNGGRRPHGLPSSCASDEVAGRKLADRADGDNGNRQCGRWVKPPLRPSEGLQVLCAGKACPPQWRIRVTEPVNTPDERENGAP
jgi:hypothetical protein